MATATQLTVSNAAAHVGVTRQTIFKAIKSGKLSATQNRQGHMQVNVVELLRVYGELQSPEQVEKNRLNRQQHQPEATATALLQLELERAKLMLERKDFELSQMRERVDELRERERAATEEKLRLFGIIERQTLLLTAPKAASKSATTPAKTNAKPSQTPAKLSAARKTAPTQTTAKPQGKRIAK